MTTICKFLICVNNNNNNMKGKNSIIQYKLIKKKKSYLSIAVCLDYYSTISSTKRMRDYSKVD